MQAARAKAELLTAAALWGFGFIGWVWLLRDGNSSQGMLYRFALATAFGFIYLLFNYKKVLFREVKLALIPSILLFVNLWLQVWGLEYTTPTKSGFITCLYVLIVPLIEKIFFRGHISLKHFVFVIIALLGMAMMMNFNFSEWNKGDTLTFLCAFVAAGHIISIDRVSHKTQHGFLFNVYQTFFCFLFSILLCFAKQETFFFHLSTLGWVGLIILALGATTIAFAFQIKAQKKVSSSLASIMFLLEAPFAMLFAIIFLNDHPTKLQYLGALVIFVSCSLAVKVSSPSTHLK